MAFCWVVATPPPSVSSWRLLGSPGKSFALGRGGELGSFCPRLRVVVRAQFRETGVLCELCGTVTYSFGKVLETAGVLGLRHLDLSTQWKGRQQGFSADKAAVERQSTEMGFCFCHLLNDPVCDLEDAPPF